MKVIPVDRYDAFNRSKCGVISRVGRSIQNPTQSVSDAKKVYTRRYARPGGVSNSRQRSWIPNWWTYQESATSHLHCVNVKNITNLYYCSICTLLALPMSSERSEYGRLVRWYSNNVAKPYTVEEAYGY